jgi:hypothetical protein
MLDTPTLLIVFNRPKETQKVFAAIRKARPRQLFIAADGARLDHATDVENCRKVREIVSKIDWNCTIQTLFRDENIGCRQGVGQAITWFFEHVEEGIILEDDCLPHPSFFVFCQIMLEKYRYTEGVLQVAGTNYLYGKYAHRHNGYYFSAHSGIWGWATWRRAWSKFEDTLDGWEAFQPILKERIQHVPQYQSLLRMYALTAAGQLDTWDTIWNYHFHRHQGLCVTPNGNLVRNIGWSGVHFFGFRHPALNMPVQPFDAQQPFEPPALSIDFEKDHWAYQNMHQPKWRLRDRFFNKFKRLYDQFTRSHS